MRRLLVLGSIVALGDCAGGVSGAGAGARADADRGAARRREAEGQSLHHYDARARRRARVSAAATCRCSSPTRGVTLVDTKLAAWGQALLDKVKSITPKPVTTIINTHSHGDHTGNNDKFGKVEVIAHENTKANMAKMPAFAGDNAQFLPSQHLHRQTLRSGKGDDRRSICVTSAPRTRTVTRVIVFPALRIAQMGDMFAWKDGAALRSRQRRQLRRVSEDACGARRVAEKHRHGYPRSQPDDESERRRRSISASWRTWCRRARRR